MATGYSVNSVDLDDLFMALGGGTPTSATGYSVLGTDLNQRFYPYLGGTKVGTTGYKVNSVDLADIFQKLGETGTVTWTTTAQGNTTEGDGFNVAASLVTWNTNGTVTQTGFGGIDDWGSNIIDPADFEWRWTSKTATFTFQPGTQNVWYPLSSSTTWGWGAYTGSRGGQVTIEIRKGTDAAIAKVVSINQSIGG
jgi:hypothetical protein